MDECDADRSRGAVVETKERRFKVAEANRTLPLVRRIVADVVDQYAYLQRLGTPPETRPRPDSDAAGELSRHASGAVDRLNGLIGELAAIGCQVKDLQAGLVDFPGRRDGRKVLLCWKPGEARIMYWHEPHAGFSGRRPIDQACE